MTENEKPMTEAQEAGLKSVITALAGAFKDEEKPIQSVKYDDIEKILDSLEFKFNVIEGTTTTTCHAFYQGFSVGYGMSACVDPRKFNKELGEEYAMVRAKQDAFNTLWLCEGYALRFHTYIKP